jgi:hypothetical protein
MSRAALPSTAAFLLAAALAGILAVSGTIKVIDPEAAAKALRRVVPRPSRLDERQARRAARVVGLVELAVAVMLLLDGRVALAGALAAVALCVCFYTVTAVAVRRGLACGCWGSLSDGPAGTRELRRRGYLVAIALFVAVAFVWSPPEHASTAATAFTLLWLGISAMAGLAIATQGPRRRLAPGWLQRAAAFGASPSTSGRHEIRRSERRRLVELLRRDPTIVAMIADLDTDVRLDWARLRATRPERDAPSTLVAIPGDGVNLRVILVDGTAVSVIRETRTGVVFRAGGVIQDRAAAASAGLR